jgi:hypothetical protein
MLSLCCGALKPPEAFPAVLDATLSRQRAKTNTMSKDIEKS